MSEETILMVFELTQQLWGHDAKNMRPHIVQIKSHYESISKGATANTRQWIHLEHLVKKIIMLSSSYTYLKNEITKRFCFHQGIEML